MVKRMLIFFMLLFLPLQLQAAENGKIELRSVSEVEETVMNSNGEQEIIRVDASLANVTPGDTVIFTNYYANNGEEPADDVVITNPVPEHMVYIAGSAGGEETEVRFSVDQGKTYGTPDELKVQEEDGKERPAVAADYTHIRWILAKSIGKGGKGSVFFRAVLE